ncbi:hypothetical protein [Synechococcus sp. RS9916]|uniref:hypothetical protein n=1 Tax=Synechococcus sp. RS9916 TaxID=221359 RepID=UPI0000E53E3E|nr:hypothetical protein [Synechococcus sp. RS9916]EAU73041.1 hypothetical protein RS9916_26059 [Synechococcus sp. RS9916]
MQAAPLIILTLAFLLDWAFSVFGILTKWSLFPDIFKFQTAVTAVVCIFSAFLAAALLIAKKFESRLMGFSVTAVCAAASAYYVTAALSWFVD